MPFTRTSPGRRLLCCGLKVTTVPPSPVPGTLAVIITLVRSAPVVMSNARSRWTQLVLVAVVSLVRTTNHIVLVTGSDLTARRDNNVGPFSSRGNVQRTQPLDEIGAGRCRLPRAHNQPHRFGHGINDRRAYDAKSAAEILVIATTGTGHIAVARSDEVCAINRAEKIG